MQQDEFDGLTTFGELPTCSKDDPSMEAARNLDWAEFLGQLDKRQLVMLGDVAVGESAAYSLRKKKVKYPVIHKIKESVAAVAVECLGEDALADSSRKPHCWGDLNAERERAACKVH